MAIVRALTAAKADRYTLYALIFAFPETTKSRAPLGAPRLRLDPSTLGENMIRREAMQQVRMNNWVSFPRVSRLSPWWSSPEQTTRASDAVFVTRRPASGNSVRPRRLASGWWRAAERFWRAIRRPFRCAGAIDILAGRHSPACAAARYAKARV